MIFEKKAAIFIYTIILISIILVISSLVLSKTNLQINTNEYQKIRDNLHKKINKKSEFYLWYDKLYNSDWSWFIDNISCPDEITMSWSSSSWTFSSSLSLSWNIFLCEWIYNWSNVNLNFNSWFTWFLESSWKEETITLNNDSWNFAFENTIISFLPESYNKPDQIDDNFNSDNYNSKSISVSETWVYFDNDSDWRTKIIWILSQSWVLENIFWTNEKTNNFINSNSNNNDWFYEKIWNVENGFLHLNIDKIAKLRIIEIDRTKYNKKKELTVIWATIEKDINSWSWYIQADWSLANNKSNWYNFNFKDKDYAIFLLWNELLKYEIYWETQDWKKLYIVPIDDSLAKNFNILAWDIEFKYWVYYWKQLEISKIK